MSDGENFVNELIKHIKKDELSEDINKVSIIINFIFLAIIILIFLTLLFILT